MGVYIKYSDFQGAYSFAVHSSLIPLIEDDITLYENVALNKIFGSEMAADMLANPGNYSALLDVINIQVDDFSVEYGFYNNYTQVYGFNNWQTGRGLKRCLLGLVFFELNRSANYVGTVSGTKRMQQDLVTIGQLSELSNNHYNDSVKDANVMRVFVQKDNTTYPLYKRENQLLLNTWV